jgi:hypothetical protein
MWKQLLAASSLCIMKDEGEKLEEDTAQRQAAELAALHAGAPATPPAHGSDVGADALVAQSLYGLSVAEDDKAGGKKAIASHKRVTGRAFLMASTSHLDATVAHPALTCCRSLHELRSGARRQHSSR